VPILYIQEMMKIFNGLTKDNQMYILTLVRVAAKAEEAVFKNYFGKASAEYGNNTIENFDETEPLTSRLHEGGKKSEQ